MKLPFEKPKRKKLRKIGLMKDQAWDLRSKYIRRINANRHGIVKCFTCDSPHYWKDIQGGHFKHGHYKHTFLHPENSHPQCVACNKWRRGNLDVYEARMIEKYGKEKVEELKSLSFKPFKPTREYYEAEILKYKSLLKELDGTP